MKNKNSNLFLNFFYPVLYIKTGINIIKFIIIFEKLFKLKYQLTFKIQGYYKIDDQFNYNHLFGIKLFDSTYQTVKNFLMFKKEFILQDKKSTV